MDNALGRVIDAIVDTADSRTGLAGQPDLTAMISGLREDHQTARSTAGAEQLPGVTVDAALAELSEVFGLDDLHAFLLVAAAAADLDGRVAGCYGLLLGAREARRATVGLLLELSGAGHLSTVARQHLGKSGALRLQALIEVDDTGPLLWRTVTVPDRVTSHLLGDGTAPGEIADILTRVPAPITEQADAVANGFRVGSHLMHVLSRPSSVGLSLGPAAFAALGVESMVVDLSQAPPGTSLRPLLATAVREAALQRRCLVVTGVDEALRHDPTMLRIIERGPMPAVVVDELTWEASWCRAPVLTVHAEPLNPEGREALWRSALPAWESAFGSESWRNLVRLRLTPQEIAATAATASLLNPGVDTAAGSAADPDLAAVYEIAHAYGGRELHHAALRVQPQATLADLVLAPAARQELTDFTNWAKYREELLSTGSLAGKGNKGRGLTALFAGSPGTGKTLAAEAVAGELGVDLYVVEISTVIDKYIGETEKKLERLISEAESLNVVLFFDEADALFGSRAEVRDARDRYANQGVSYLLQRIERFDGVAILATNLRGNIDPAFSRRLHHIVTFLDPDSGIRRQLWESHLAAVPAMDNDDLPDIDWLAETIEVTGGTIRNIVMSATFGAVSDGERVGMRHLDRAVRREMFKLGRRLDDSMRISRRRTGDAGT